MRERKNEFDRIIDRWFINNGEQWLRGDGTWLWGNPQGSYLDGTLGVDTLTDGDPVIEWKSFHSGTLRIISNASVINAREPAMEAEYNASQIAANTVRHAQSFGFFGAKVLEFQHPKCLILLAFKWVRKLGTF